MMESEEILKSIKSEMEVKEKEFNEVITELATLEQNYSVRKTQLENSKEQIRGAYTALYRQLEKFSKGNSSETKQNETTTPVSTPTAKAVAPTTKTTTKKSTSTKSENKQLDTTNNQTKSEEPATKTEKSVGSLTPEEIAKINKTIPKSTTTDNNGNEIPDYLQAEYNK